MEYTSPSSAPDGRQHRKRPPLPEIDDHICMVLDTMSQEPPVVAKWAFDRLALGQHIIPTNPVSRDFVVATHQEIINAMELGSA